MKTRWSQPPVLIALALVQLSLGVVHAEHYLSVPEAQKICFPNAGKFDPQTARLSAEQIKMVERKSAVKVRDPVLRFRVARQDTNTLGVLMIDQVLGKHELIDYAVAISPQGRVLRVELLEYRENYGGAVHNSKWRDQFKGK